MTSALAPEPDNIEEDSAVAIHREITAIVRDGLALPEQEASQIAQIVTNGLRHRFSGEYLGGYYLSRGLTLREKTHRDHAIRREFTGKNIDDICKKYGVSRTSVYRICGRRLGVKK